MLEVRLLGKFEVSQDGQLIEIPSHPAQLLLAYLILNAGTAHRREKLAGLLWPDSLEDTARNNLRQTLWRLGKIVGKDCFLADKISVAFNTGIEYRLDVDRLRAGEIDAASAEALIEMVSAYEGDLLPGFYEDWVVLEQEQVQATFEQKMQLLLNRLVEARRWSEVLDWAERWIALGHSPEPAYRALMLAHGGLGDRAAVGAAYQRCVKALRQDLGVEPSEQTQQLYQQLLSPAGSSSEAPPERAGHSVLATGSYRLVDKIGAGGMAEVFKAYQPSLDRFVALKFIRQELATSGDFHLRFEREARVMAQLNHPNIVHVYDFGELDGRYYLAMEYVTGGNLKDWLVRARQSEQMMPPEQLLSILRQIGSALDFAHQQGIIHRDIKPSNIMLTAEERVLLADFGMAKLADGSGDLTSRNSTMGTPAYMAPEQIDDPAKLGPASDLYSLGAVLYELMTGQPPFTAGSPLALMFMHVNEAVPPPRSLNPTLSEAVEQVLLTALAKKPQERYQHAAELVAAYEAALQPTSHSAPSSPAISREPSPFLPGFLDNGTPPAAANKTIFIGREPEMARLEQLLIQALDGRGQTIFVTGEAGQGKTSLLDAFARRVQLAHPDLIVARGTCDVYTGVGEPFLPFREILSMLSGDIESLWEAGVLSRDHARRLWQLTPYTVQALVDESPDLIDTFLSGSNLAKHAAAYAPDGAPWLERLQALLTRRASRRGDTDPDQSRIFEEYASVLETLASRQPLLIILDDIHWADLSSISLLSYLSRRITDQAIMIIGAYRPEDVAQGRDGGDHPLTDILAEIKRRAGDVIVDLAPGEQAEGRAFVDALLDTEPNRLDEPFRQQLVGHTGGHPLFTVELLRDLQERGALFRNEQGQWIAGPNLVWGTLPVRVEGVIGKRIGRLDADLREILASACVEGETFTAEVIARTKGVDAREMVRRLNVELNRQHRLVQEQGVRRAGTQRLSLYSFRHNLFQKYLYDNLGETERMYLHEDIGDALEELYRDQTEEIAPQLARHFQEARIGEKAIGYLLQAGQQAARLSAYGEAIAHLNRGLVLLEDLPASPTQVQQEFELQLSLAKAQWKTGQVTEALNTFERSADIARGLSSPEALALAALEYEEPRWRFNLPPDPVVRLLEEALTALGDEDSALRVRVLASLARALLDTGLRERLAATAKQAVDIARRINDPVALYDALRISVQVDRRPETIADRIAALSEMVRLAEELDDGERIVVACGMRLYDLLEVGEIEAAEADLNRHVEWGPKINHIFSLHASEVYRGMWALLKGDFDEAEALAQQAFEVGQQMGAATVHGTYGIQMFSIRREQGRLKEVASVVKIFVAQNPAAAAWRPGLALIYSDLGLRRECRETFELLAADNFAGLPQDSLWLTCVAYLAEVCAFLDDTDRAAILYQFLLPYNGRVLVVGSAVACYGAVSRYLGLLATMMSDWKAAERHFEDALQLNLRLGARPWLAHTQYQYAAMFLSRGRTEDTDKARVLLDEALQTARELGMQLLIQRVEALKTSDFSNS